MELLRCFLSHGGEECFCLYCLQSLQVLRPTDRSRRAFVHNILAILQFFRACIRITGSERCFFIHASASALFRIMLNQGLQWYSRWQAFKFCRCGCLGIAPVAHLLNKAAWPIRSISDKSPRAARDCSEATRALDRWYYLHTGNSGQSWCLSSSLSGRLSIQDEAMGVAQSTP